MGRVLPLVRPVTSIANFSPAWWMWALLTRRWCQPSDLNLSQRRQQIFFAIESFILRVERCPGGAGD